MPGDRRSPAELGSQGFDALYVKVQFNLDTERGREAFTGIRDGDTNEFSVGFNVATNEKGDSGDGLLLTLGVRTQPSVVLLLDPARLQFSTDIQFSSLSPATVSKAPNAL